MCQLRNGDLAVMGRLAGRLFIASVSPEGEERWIRVYPEDPWWWTWDIEPTSDGGMVIANNMGYTFHLMKYSEDGELVWRLMEDDGQAYAVKELPDGTLIAGGATIPGPDDRRLMRVTADGEIIWDIVYPDEGDEAEIMELALSPDGHVFAGGGYQNLENEYQKWVGKFDLEGNLLWENAFEYGVIRSMAIGADGHLVTTGFDNPNGTASSAVNFEVLHFEAEVQISLAGSNDYVPSDGGTVGLEWSAENLLSPLSTFDPSGAGVYSLHRTLTARHPNGTVHHMRLDDVVIHPGQPSAWDPLTVTLPADWPDGTWTLRASVGIDSASAAWYEIPGSLGSADWTVVKGTAAVDDPGATPISPDASRPTEFELSQAYPNPFNPTTSVAVSLPASSELTVAVFNVMGQQVAELANGQFSAGAHSFTFDASHLSSGLFFIQAQVPGELNAIQKVTLMK